MEDGEPKLRVSIIIPTFNRGKVVRSTLDQLRQQNFKDFEVWLIDQSDPEDAEANAAYVSLLADPRIHYLYLTQRGPSNARNEGFARARGDIILCLDDDVIILTPDFITAHLRAYQDPSVGGVTGRHVERVLRMNARDTACYVAWNGRTIFNLFGTQRVEVGSMKGSNMSFRREILKQVGGFDRRTPFLEETDFSTRVRNVGWRLMYEPDAELVHLSVPAGGTREKTPLQNEARRFESTAYYVRKHRGNLSVAGFILTFAAIGLVRAVRYRSISVISVLYAAIQRGLADARQPPDEQLPVIGEPVPNSNATQSRAPLLFATKAL